MSKHKKASVTKTIIKFIMIAPVLFNIVQKIISLICVETKVAGKSLIFLIMLAILMGSLLTGTWFGFLALLIFYFLSLHLSLVVSIALVLGFNVIALIILVLCMSQVKNTLTFP
jgi:hypothetical protein